MTRREALAAMAGAAGVAALPAALSAVVPAAQPRVSIRDAIHIGADGPWDWPPPRHHFELRTPREYGRIVTFTREEISDGPEARRLRAMGPR